MRKVLSALAGLVLLVSVLLTLVRFVPFTTTLTAMAAAFSTYAVVGYLLAIALLLGLVRKAKRRGPVLAGVVVSLVAIGLHAFWVAPLYYGNAEGTRGELTVLTANTEFGQADAAQLVRGASASDVDVLVLQEVTPAELARLDDSGLGDLLPNREGEPSDDADGTMVFSAEPLTDAKDLGLGNGGFSVRVGGDQPFTLIAVHTTPPTYGAPRWREDLAAVRAAAKDALADGPVVAAGDFNATSDHAQFRDVLGVGLSDTRAQANAGWQPTWPTAEVYQLLPLIPIDHVLTSPQFSARSSDVVVLDGSDHRGLLVSLDRI